MTKEEAIEKLRFARNSAERNGNYYASLRLEDAKEVQALIEQQARRIADLEGLKTFKDSMTEQQLTTIRAENEALRKDGERLDWLQANGTTGYWYEEGCQRDYAFPAIRMKNQWAGDPVSDDIRQAIDAAIAAELRDGKERTSDE